MDGAWEWALKTRVNGLVIHLLCPLTPLPPPLLAPLPPPPHTTHTLPPFSVLFCPVDTQASAHVHSRTAAQPLHNFFGLIYKCLLPSPRFKTERQRGMQVFTLIPNMKPFSAGLSRNTYFGELERILFCTPLIFLLFIAEFCFNRYSPVSWTHKLVSDLAVFVLRDK